MPRLEVSGRQGTCTSTLQKLGRPSLSAIIAAIVFFLLVFLSISSHTLDTFNLPTRLRNYSEAASWLDLHSEETTEDIAYLQTGPLQEYQAISLAFARYTHPKATIHLIRTHASDNDARDDAKVGWEALFNSIDVKVNNGTEDSEAHLALKKNYKHSSTNPPAYELFCYMRWPTLYEYMKRNQIERALVMDADIFPFTNIFEQHPYPDWSSHEKGIYMQIFTRERIGAFVFYMNAFYNRPVHMVCDQLELMGSSEWSDSPIWALPRTRRQNIKCPGKKPVQFSDMYLFVGFQRDYKLSQVADSHDLTETFNRRWRPVSLDMCKRTDDFRIHLEEMADQIYNTSLAMKKGDEETSFVHLQGHCKWLTCDAFCRHVKPEHARMISCCK